MSNPPARVPPPPLGPPPKGAFNYIQDFIDGMDGNLGTKILRMAGAVVLFFLIATWFDWHGNHSFTTREAMESAHLGRRLAQGQGYTTLSIRPSAVGMWQRAHPGEAAAVLQNPLPDLSVAPGYPVVLAGLMKLLPFHFTADRDSLWAYQPDLWIAGFNQLLFFASALALYQIARRLFDKGVAWLAAVVFGGSELYWRLSASGLSTMWLVFLFLGLTWCLARLEERERGETPGSPAGAVRLALAAGVLTGLGGLSRYSYAWMIIPVCVFLGAFIARQRIKLVFAALAAFVVVMAPWLARNYALGHSAFGTAGYAWLQNTRVGEEDRVERAFDANEAGLNLIGPRDVLNKFLANEGRILRDDLPHLGGTWAAGFFLCGLLLPFRNAGLRRLRWFLVWSLALMAIVQGLGETYLSVESPEINSENMLAVIAPMAMVYGAGFFFILLDQMAIPDLRMRPYVAASFAAALCVPFLVNLVAPVRGVKATALYLPFQIQKTAEMMKPNELMMSDAAWAVAWYGNRPCAWLTMDDDESFHKLSDLKPVEGVYLTERSTDQPFLGQELDRPDGWGHFYLSALPAKLMAHGTAPKNFSLTLAQPGYVPLEMFLTDPRRETNASSTNAAPH